MTYGKKSDQLIYSGTKLLPDMLWSWELNSLLKWEIVLVLQPILKPLKILKVVLFQVTGMETSFKKKPVDKKMLLSLLDSTMDMLMIHSSPLMMLWLLRPLKPITNNHVFNIQLTKLITKTKFLESYTEDMLEITMLEVTHGFYQLEP